MNLSDRAIKWWETGGSVWTRRATYPVVFALAGFFIFATLRGPEGVLSLLKKREDIQHLQKENAAQAEENERLRKQLQQVKSSQSERDNVVRKELNLARPGETTFILKPKKK